ncbi:hypothetical protein METBIDRAFT_9285 [Metschnikowia bicuspidata var. bicuspidata NRRL YB-4993]|uniref:Uncharacterized protein n=1 Tax=Metschnikowia bicuspidata var. bicuspidata NRRL YB-4993 TaxID=869754 RepID=A0A1A0HG12_9ASCO|nr:hypothetical protein METBIDRAFT_9285 [Metschnikowia bicuspidata var. bicuspidata NRRL YB-4993]OBA22941.1 hypothetical protein METBIDRAFT_9285 [Metschnikowia bicuspidata var. bicuspidata NRRL YB-4993]
MSDDQLKQVRSAVNHVISNYQLTSKSKLFQRLSSKNVDLISKGVMENKQDKHLMELIKKRDYYTRKIHELLNDSGEEKNPRLIVDEAEAGHYIRKRLLKDVTRSEQIKSLIRKHRQFQVSATEEQDKIIQKYRVRKPLAGGLKKIGSMNAAIDAKLNAEREAELQRFYTNLMQKQSEYCLESERLLRNLDVPFFNLLLDDHSVTKSQKVFVLDLLYKVLAEKL